MSGRTHYETLGILSDAPDVVVRAAYKALAQAYHPDRQAADHREAANARMAEINRAYQVLSDPEARRAYDHEMAAARAEFGQASTSGEFNAAWALIDRDWWIATAVYPEIEPMRVRLGRISDQLAFGFAVTLLEAKQFAGAAEIAARMETAFLKRYFGTNEQIIDLAKRLILAGERAAAVELNNIVVVLGTGVDPGRVIKLIDSKHRVFDRMRERASAEEAASELKALKEAVADGDYSASVKLARLHHYKVTEKDGGFFARAEIHVQGPTGTKVFDTRAMVVQWVQEMASTSTSGGEEETDLRCPSCRTELTIPSRYAARGKVVRCPKCAAAFDFAYT